MSTESEMTATEAVESLNGFDEIAIAANFGMKITSMREDPYTFLRALVFVDKRREGLKDKEAFQASMELPAGRLASYFKADDPLGDESEGKETPA